ncbi:MoxR family ATPase [Streptomyces sp. H51]|uniref:MoxR family ATPase n=1 Tax=Streptomyces sp. H51 TaxID=3111770 RepID=UPI002D799810|nr:MoxR family ATPase [Streptomyces sp. H51]
MPNSVSWGPYRGTGLPGTTHQPWPEAPPWRSFGGGPDLPPPPAADPYARIVLGAPRQPLPAPPEEVDRVNAALRLSRPLLVTGEPGTGKSTLAYRISRELGLGRVLRWRITSLSTLREGLYETGDGGRIGLGPLGTAFLPYARPRVLLIDRLDRAEIALPDDLCTVLAAGGFRLPGPASVPSLRSATSPGIAAPSVSDASDAPTEPDAPAETRVATDDDPAATVVLPDRSVRSHAFPVIVITTTGERDLSPDLVRRCVTLRTRRPGPELLRAIAANHFPPGPSTPTSLPGPIPASASASASPAPDPAPAPAPDVVDAFLDRAVRSEGPVVERFLDALRLAADGVLTTLAEDGGWQEAVDTVWEWTAPEEP